MSGSTELDRVTITVRPPTNPPTATPVPTPSGNLKVSKDPIDISEKAVLTAYDLKNLPSGNVKFKLSGPIRFNSACTNTASAAQGEEATIAAGTATTDIYGCSPGGSGTARVTTSTDVELASITVNVNTPTATPTPQGDISADPSTITIGQGTLVQATNLQTNGKGARFVKEGPLHDTSSCGLPGLRGEDPEEQSDNDKSQWFYGCAPGGDATVKLVTLDKTATVVLDSVGITVNTPTPEPTFTPTPTKTPTPIVCPVPTTESNAGPNEIVPVLPTQAPICPTATPVPDEPTVEIKSIETGFRTLKIDWEYKNISNPKIDSLKIYYTCSNCPNDFVNLKTSSQTSFIFKGIETSDSDVGLDEDTTYTFKIDVVFDTDQHGQVTDSAESTAKTLEPLAFESVITRLDGISDLEEGLPLERMGWTLMTSARTEIEVDLQSDITGSYVYSISVPQNTGLQVYKSPSNAGNISYHPTCQWGSWPTQTLIANLKPSDAVHLVSCAIGDGTSKATYRIKNTKHDYEWIIDEVQAIQPLHNPSSNIEVALKSKCATEPIVGLNFRSEVVDAMKRWKKSWGFELIETIDSNAECGQGQKGKATVETYDQSKAKYCGDGSGICVKRPLLLKGSHYDRREMFIPYKFDGSGNIGHQFTQYYNFHRAKCSSGTNGSPGKCINTYYLPTVLTHEFGHVIGLGHSGGESDMMHWLHPEYPPIRPGSRDIKAVNKLYGTSHVHP